MAGRGRKCEPQCGCKRHTAPKRYSDEEREQARLRQLEVNREYSRRRRLHDPDYRAKQREFQRIHGRRYFLKYKFGMTPDQWDERLEAQGGCCYLCNEPLADRKVHVDHDRSCCRGDRSCGTCIRGLACQLCNQGIGQFGDDPERMRRVADNLEMANAITRTRTSRPLSAEVETRA